MSEPQATDSAPPPSAMAWLSTGRFGLILAGMIFIPFYSVLLGLDTFAVRDFGLFSFPVAYFQRQCFWQGQIPFWNSLNCLGLPFLAQFNTLALYPPALIYLVLPLTWALPFFCLCHLFWGGLGMFALARRWTGSPAGAALAGIAFAFNGLPLNFLMWPSHIATFAWMPWVILLTERGWRTGGRALAVAAVAAALQILGGGPETILFTWLVVAAVFLGVGIRNRNEIARWLGRFVLMLSLALALSAAQWLPFADFALHSSRNTNYATAAWAMPALGWANFLEPLFQASRWQNMAVQKDQYWTSSYYAGIGTILLALLACRRRCSKRVVLVGIFVLVSLVLALGDHGFVLPWLRRILPFLGLFRFPVKFVILTSALLPLLAAYGFSQYERNPVFGPRTWMTAAILILLTAGVTWWGWWHPGLAGFGLTMLQNAETRCALLGVFLFALWLYARQPNRRPWTIALMWVVMWVDLITAVPWQNPTLDASVYQPDLGRMSAHFSLEPNPAQSRLVMSSSTAHHLYYHPAQTLNAGYAVDRAAFFADCNLLDNYPKVDGFYSLYLKETDRVLWLLDANTGDTLNRVQNLLGVSQTIAPGKILDWTARPDFLPIVSIGQAPIFADAETTFAALTQSNADFHREVYLPLDAAAKVQAGYEPKARVISTDFQVNRQSIQVETPSPTMMFLSQAYYHNWRARVDGKIVPLWRANYAFQAVSVPAGRHAVSLVYQDNAFMIGLIVGGVAGLLCLWLAWRKHPNARVNQIPPLVPQV